MYYSLKIVVGKGFECHGEVVSSIRLITTLLLPRYIPAALINRSHNRRFLSLSAAKQNAWPCVLRVIIWICKNSNNDSVVFFRNVPELEWERKRHVSGRGFDLMLLEWRIRAERDENIRERARCDQALAPSSWFNAGECCIRLSILGFEYAILYWTTTVTLGF